MKEIKIIDLAPDTISGVDVRLPGTVDMFRETYWEWMPAGLSAPFRNSRIAGGVLRAWHHLPVFDMIESHLDEELFYFISGVAIMVFCDIANDLPVMDSVQIARIQPGTVINIAAGKGHYVAVAESTDPLVAVVVAPNQDAPKVRMAEQVVGIV